MNPKENMLIAKGRFITKDVKSCDYDPITQKVCITYLSGKSYLYNHSNVTWLRNPEQRDPATHRFYYDRQALFDVSKAFRFSDERFVYWHICFQNGFEQDYRDSELKVVQSCMNDEEAKSVFAYLARVAESVSIQTDDGINLLSRQYDKIDFIGTDTALAAYLNPDSYRVLSRSIVEPIFPFGCNMSQYRAVRTALENQISVIQGPPGTGKTQTILNIIANLLIQGKTVQVVSNNNSATENVLEKLSQDKYRMGFIVAPLGKRENKERFIQHQTGRYPELSGWHSDIELESFSSELKTRAEELQTLYKKQERLAVIRQERHAFEVEYRHFCEYSKETNVGATTVPTKRNLRTDQLMQLWQEYQKLEESGVGPSFFTKLKYSLIYGITDWSFYKRETEDVVASIQRTYYESKLDELEEEILYLDNELSEHNVNDIQKRYTELSMRYLQNKLYEKYSSRGIRKVFSLDDLWMNSQGVLEEYPVVLSTTYSARNSLGENTVFDYLIMDEASQVDVATGALALSCANNVVIVGDEKQLPNVVTEKTRKEVDAIFDSFQIHEGYRFSENSFLRSICSRLPDVPQTMLREHYRCHPKIIEYCNQKYYQGNLVIMTEDHDEKDVISVLKTTVGNHERDHMSQRQVEAVMQEVLPKIQFPANEIGIIAPYNNQVGALRRSVPDRSIDVATVHKFQGREKDAIILTTVDDVVTYFSDDPYLLNVAVSRAKKQLYLVVSGNEQPNDSNIGDLIAYIEYNNYQVSQSHLYSVFDLLYSQYTDARKNYLERHKKISEYDSENLMFGLVEDVLHSMPERPLAVACHMPLRMLLRDFSLLGEDERKYAMNYATHLDFLIYNKVSKKMVLAIEVDGYHYHKAGTIQAERDKKKNHILEIYGIPYLRFATNGSNERDRLITKLDDIFRSE